MAELQLTDKSVKELVQLGRNAVGAQVPVTGALPFVVIPQDHKIQDLKDLVYNEYTPFPIRKEGTVKVFDAGSFCDYYTLFCDPNSRVFADETTGRILAVLDYHGAGSDGGPRWGKHRIDLTLRDSTEWKRWTGSDGKKFSQLDFAEFIEDNAPDIIDPNGAAMLEVARDLQARTEADFGSAVRLQNGQVQFKYSETIRATVGAGQLEVPERFKVAIPVHIGGDRVGLTARLRYRISSGKLTFWFDLLRADAIKRDAFLAVRQSIGDSLAITVINGVPA